MGLDAEEAHHGQQQRQQTERQRPDARGAQKHIRSGKHGARIAGEIDGQLGIHVVNRAAQRGGGGRRVAGAGGEHHLRVVVL